MTKTYNDKNDEEDYLVKFHFDLYVKCKDFKEKLKNKEKQQNINCDIYYEKYIEHKNKPK